MKNITNGEWWKKAAVRAVKTMAQTAAALIGTGKFLGDVDWVQIGSAALMAGVFSMVTSVAGIPEVSSK